MKLNSKFYLLICYFLTINFSLFSQPGNDQGGGGLEGGDPLPGAPVNNLLYIGLFASICIIYSFYILKNRKKAK